MLRHVVFGPAQKPPIGARAILRRALLLFWLSNAVLCPAAQTSAPTATIDQGSRETRTLAGSEAHSYAIRLERGDFLQAVVRQSGIDVVVTARTPDAKVVAAANGSNFAEGPRRLRFVAPESGLYSLEVKSDAAGQPDAAGSYELAVDRRGPATDRDRALLEANGLARQANDLAEKGEYERALPVAERAAALHEEALGPDAPEVAEILTLVGTIANYNADYARAAAVLARAIDIEVRAVGPDGLAVATPVGELALVYSGQGEYEKAEPLMLRALAVREKALGPDHPEVATSLNDLGELYAEMGEFERARPLFERSLAVRERALGPDHEDVAVSLNDLASLYNDDGRYARATPLLDRALAIRERALGPDHPEVAQALNNLAVDFKRRGDFPKAEALLTRALAVWERALGPKNPEVAAALNNLGNLYLAEGAYTRAAAAFSRSRSIFERALGARHRNVGLVLYNLARVLDAQGSEPAAAAMCERALEIRERALGPDHIDVGYTLSMLGDLFRRRGDGRRAEELDTRALAIFSKAFGAECYDAGVMYHHLGAVRELEGRHAEAESLFRRSADVIERTAGADNPQLAVVLGDLDRVLLALGHVDEAVAIQGRVNDVREHDLARNLLVGSEQDKLAFSALTAGELDLSVSLHARSAPKDPRATTMAMEEILRRKGRVLDATVAGTSAVTRDASRVDRALLDDLADARRFLSSMILNGPRDEEPSAYRDRVDATRSRVDELERAVSLEGAGRPVGLPPVTLDRVRAAIPAECALVEYVSYRPFDARSRGYGARRYAVYVLRQTGPPGWADLGEAAAIDADVAILRRALGDPRSSNVGALARRVDEQIARPARVLVGDASRLFLSPDAALNLVPFAVLVDENGRYLLERYTVSYLTSGRDLLRPLAGSDRAVSRPVVVADPEFSARVPDRTAVARSTGATGIRGASADAPYFVRLPGTREEGRALSALLEGSRLLTRGDATERAVKSLRAPSILHIATHGFFFAERTVGGKGRSGGTRRTDPAIGRVEDPLTRSGLALAGANERAGGDGEDGILTALEVSSLDLWGTRLVVLSACQTGYGAVREGDGIFGLRRALVLAGSESQLMSLWDEDDRAGRDFMVAFYRELLAGADRAEALRRVQLAALASPATAHPYYWAGAILSGSTSSLDLSSEHQS